MNVTTEATENSTSVGYDDPGVNWWGLGGVFVFYIVILLVGIFASWRNQKREDCEEVMLAGRNIGLCVGIFTMTATWVGGGYINGTAESVYTPGFGLVWTQAALAYSLSLLLSGIFFARKMRRAGYVTMLDPFHERYGRIITSFMYLPPLMGDVFWSAAILSALGGSLAVILGIDHKTAVIISACIAVFYTVVGGLYSVAFTDVIQLSCIFVGLWLGVGFAINHEAVSSISDTANTDMKTGWIGKVYYEENGPNQEYWIGNYIDSFVLILLGGIPWQAYFQRVLSSKTEAIAQILSIIASFGCIFMAVPAALIGAIAKSTDWSKTEYAKYSPLNGTHLLPEDYKIVLPLVLQYLCPTFVAVIGLGAVSAAVMSSTDSSILSASTMFARNIYKPLREAIRTKGASEREIIWVMRIAVLFVGAAATCLAIIVNSIYALWFLCSDLVYVILFPQFALVVHTQFTNAYGSMVGFLVGMVLRFTGGEPLLGMSALIKYPWYDEATGFQLFPFKTMIVIITLVIIVLVSLSAEYLFKNGVISQRLDIFRAFKEEKTVKSLSTTSDIVRLEKSMNKQETQPINGADIPMTIKMSPELQPMMS